MAPRGTGHQRPLGLARTLRFWSLQPIAMQCSRPHNETRRCNGFVGCFPEVAFYSMQQGKEPVWERTYNLLWQREALRGSPSVTPSAAVRSCVHHLTWGGVRAPTFLGTLGAPLIIGPVGGGETSPASLRDRLPLRGRILESVAICRTRRSNSTRLCARVCARPE